MFASLMAAKYNGISFATSSGDRNRAPFLILLWHPAFSISSLKLCTGSHLKDEVRFIWLGTESDDVNERIKNEEITGENRKRTGRWEAMFGHLLNSDFRRTNAARSCGDTAQRTL